VTDPRLHDAVDAALEAEARAARAAKLPPALRVRILAARCDVAEPLPRRGRILDFALRAAAVAASVAAVALLLPDSLAAAEIDVAPLAEWNSRISAVVKDRLMPVDIATDFASPLPRWDPGLSLPLLGAAAALVAGGMFLLRRERRP
jgi:hypothetical protein